MGSIVLLQLEHMDTKTLIESEKIIPREYKNILQTLEGLLGVKEHAEAELAFTGIFEREIQNTEADLNVIKLTDKEG